MKEVCVQYIAQLTDATATVSTKAEAPLWTLIVFIVFMVVVLPGLAILVTRKERKKIKTLATHVSKTKTDISS